MKSNPQWLTAILILPFVKGCIYPGWSSAAELSVCCVLVAFFHYFRPQHREISDMERDIADLKNQLAATSGSLTNLKLKVGFRQ